MAVLDSTGALFFVLATGFYTGLLQGVSYRTMLTVTFMGRVLVSAFDYMFVTDGNIYSRDQWASCDEKDVDPSKVLKVLVVGDMVQGYFCARDNGQGRRH